MHHIIFYGLPDHANYYPEIVNRIETESAHANGESATVTLIVNPFDRLKMDRIFGQRKTEKILKSRKDTFLLTL